MQLSRQILELQELFLQNHSSPQCELRWLSIAGILIKINLVNTMHWNALNVHLQQMTFLTNHKRAN